MIIRHTFIDPSYWAVNSGNLENSTVFNQSVPTWILDPVTLSDILGSGKDCVLPPIVINSNFKTTLTNTISIPNASNFTVTAFNSRGWTTGNQATLITEIASFFANNLNNVDINPGLDSLDLILAIGNIQGVNYIIPFGYLGSVGTVDSLIPNVFGAMLFTETLYDCAYGYSLFTDTTFDLVVNGGPW